MTAADKLRELLATRPAMPNTEELVRWWRASAELVRQVLDGPEVHERTVLTTGRLDGLTITPVLDGHEIRFLEFTVETLPGLRLTIEAAASRELRDALDMLLGGRTQDVASSAFDEIAKLCGCPTWEYPGQVIRDVQAVVEQRDAARANLAEVMRYVDDAKRSAGLDRLSGEPLAEFIEHTLSSHRTMRDDLDDVRAKLRREQDARAELRVERDDVAAEAKEHISTLGTILATCVEVGGTPCDAPGVAVRKLADALIEAREGMRTTRARSAACTGLLSHDEFTPCPVHDVPAPKITVAQTPLVDIDAKATLAGKVTMKANGRSVTITVAKDESYAAIAERLAEAFNASEEVARG